MMTVVSWTGVHTRHHHVLLVTILGLLSVSSSCHHVLMMTVVSWTGVHTSYHHVLLVTILDLPSVTILSHFMLLTWHAIELEVLVGVHFASRSLFKTTR
ncbi:hypothetical protein F5Y08DRAFT_318637 [Xylaria arbuscula]|nr:hypothetical protein F5Y08DRAFT_318637 [Xylaria arbuscula]